MSQIESVPDDVRAEIEGFEDDSFERAAVEFVDDVRRAFLRRADDAIEREMVDFIAEANAATEAEEAAGWEGIPE